MTFAEKVVAIENYEQFVAEGEIGDAPLRLIASTMMVESGLPRGGMGNITTWMRDIAVECYRSFAMLYIKEQDPKMG